MKSYRVSKNIIAGKIKIKVLEKTAIKSFFGFGKTEVKYNKKEIDENINVSILTFITVFGFLFVIGTISLSFFGTELEKCVFLAISALSNFGHHVGLSDFPDAGKIILSFLMILGRLEIYPLLLLFVPLFYNTPGNITEKISERE